MNKRINLTNLGGFPLTQDVIDFMQQSYRASISALAKMCGDKVIITGVDVAGNNVSDGWIVFNGELMPFVGGSLGLTIIISETAETLVFEDASTPNVLFTKTATSGVGGSFAFSELIRIEPLRNTWLKSDIKEIDCDGAYISANFDATGLGKNERKGWAICNGQNGTKDRGGRIGVGYSTLNIDPSDNVWDIIYTTMGLTGGEKKHTLTIAELPSHYHSINQGNSYTGSGGVGTVGRGSDNPNSFNSGSVGSNNPHENRQPFIVSLFIQKL
jgi:hypothetical protein